tara:strand:- start:179 stop:535 length:357 start_codon:yes stop_codon:yes gene_type:complete
MSLALQKQNKESKYKFYKWTNGEILKKSLKQNIEEKSDDKIKNEEKKIDEFFDYRSFRKDLELSKKSNDKSICNDRLTDRDKIIQRNINPFLSNNNYLSDLSIQDEFLRPKNSSYGKK